jgi:GDPmannose 4,6-dehydratase
LGDPSKAKKDLGWEPKISLESLVEEMIDNDLKEAKKRFFIESQKF